jgi:hypothetical protein
MMGPATFDLVDYADRFRESGYFVQEGVFGEADIERLRAAVAAMPDRDEVRRKRGTYGIRHLLEICPEVRELSARQEVRRFVTPILGDGAFAVRAVFFDKIPGANWSLFWHQDNVVAVKDRLDLAGFVGWSCKAGRWQVQPPSEVLARMVAVRVHLDDCGTRNGPLRVLPGSHRRGWVDGDLDEWKARIQEVVCSVGLGGVVMMCPLVLHASAPSLEVGHRRVIHIEFAVDELPGGLEWASRVGGEGTAHARA